MYFPLWKQMIWKLFGKKVVGYDFSFDHDRTVIVVSYAFRGVTYIAKEIVV